METLRNDLFLLTTVPYPTSAEYVKKKTNLPQLSTPLPTFFSDFNYIAYHSGINIKHNSLQAEKTFPTATTSWENLLFVTYFPAKENHIFKKGNRFPRIKSCL